MLLFDYYKQIFIFRQSILKVRGYQSQYVGKIIKAPLREDYFEQKLTHILKKNFTKNFSAVGLRKLQIMKGNMNYLPDLKRWFVPTCHTSNQI